MLERIEPRGVSMKTIEIAPVSNKPHRDEHDGLTHKLKIAGSLGATSSEPDQLSGRVR